MPKKNLIIVFVHVYDAAGTPLPLTDVTINKKKYKTNKKGYAAIPLRGDGTYTIAICENTASAPLSHRSIITAICPNGGITISPSLRKKSIGFDIFSYDNADNPLPYVDVKFNAKVINTGALAIGDGRLSAMGYYDISACGNILQNQLLDDGDTVVVHCPNGGIVVTHGS